MRVDPSTLEEPSGTGVRDCGEGLKTLIPVAYIVRNVNTKKGPCDVMDVGFVCISDHEEGGFDAGSVLKISFWLTDRALWVLNRLCDALGNKEPFDTDSDDDMGRIFALGAVRAKVRVEEREGRDRTFRDYDVSPYEWKPETGIKTDPTTGAPMFSTEVSDMIKSSEEHFAKRFAPRPDYSGSSTSGYSANSGGNQGATFQDDDVPF